MYGIQTFKPVTSVCNVFENDVKMYGIQTDFISDITQALFENDVKMYGIQTVSHCGILMI